MSMLSFFLLVAFLAIGLSVLWLRYRVSSLRWQLADANLRLQSVLDNMVEGVVVIDHDRRIILMNRRGSRMISVDEQGVSYALVEEQYEAFTASGDPLPFEQWPSSRALRGDFVQEFRIRHRNRITGDTGARIMNTAPMPGPRGDAGQIIISYRDDSERTVADDARSRLANIVESSNDAIVSVSLEGKVLTWNKGAEKIIGYSSEEMIGESMERLLAADDSDLMQDALKRVAAGETVEKFDTPQKTRDGRILRIDISISPIRDAGGVIQSASIIARDITETRNLERQFQQAQKMEAIGQLTGGIAHDFNNLLGVVSGNLDLLEGLIEGNQPALHRATLARKAASRAADLTRRLLAFSSKETLKPISTSLEHSVRNALEIAVHALGPSIRISTDIIPIHNVYIDPAGLESALLNLIVNARDAMESGGLLHVISKAIHLDETHPYVANGYLKPGTYAFVSVTDTGSGMTKETLERVFEPFFTTKERGRGTGLGLPMVYGFARQSKGHVQIYSEAGQGTTVSLYLPFATSNELPAQPTEKYTARSFRRHGGKILLVDDEIELLDVSSAYLNKLGYITLLAQDGPHALQLVNEHPGIDLMVTDIVMPGGLNGVELSNLVAQSQPQIRTIYTSGFPEDALAEKNFKIGEHVLLNKPYRLAELAEAVDRALQHAPELVGTA